MGSAVQILEKKECRLCYQAIDARAEKCPFCGVTQQQRRLKISPVAAVGALLLALTAIGFAGALYMDVIELRRELEGTRLSVASLAAERTAVEPSPQSPVESPTSIPEPVEYEADSELDARFAPEAAEYATHLEINALELRAAWALLVNCDQIGNEACTFAAAEFREHVPEEALLQCIGGDSSTRLCWLRLE